MSAGRCVVIGVGNDYRSDDGVGLAVAARLRGRTPAGVEIVACAQEPSRLIDAWQEAEAVLVIDAASSGEPPGTVHRFDASTEPIPDRVFRSSTHAFGVGEAIEFARALHKLPERVLVYGIEGGVFGAGAELSAPVAAAVDRAAEAVLEDLERLSREEAECTSEH